MAKIVGFGALFGFVLSRAGATDYDAIRGMFLLRDLHLAGVMATAIALLAGVFALSKRRAVRALNGQALALAPKPMTSGLVVGGLLFGAGWALSGTCPGTALAQLGEGRLAALATLAGILVSATSVEAWQSRAKRPAVTPADSVGRDALEASPAR